MKVLCSFMGGMACLAVSIQLFFYGFTEPVANQLWREKSRPATGTVIELKTVREGAISARYPVVEFFTEDGARHTFISKLRSTDIERFTVNQTLPVRYSLHDPQNAVIDTSLRTWAPMAVFIAVGGIALAASAVLFVLGMRWHVRSRASTGSREAT